VIQGPGAEWLEARREELNQRFLMARRRYPRLAPGPVLDLLARVVPPIADAGGSHALLSAVYDLVLLHAGRDAMATHPGLATLLLETVPRLRVELERAPGLLVPSLSNAVENLREKGDAFARAVPAIVKGLDDPRTMLDASAVLAWRLGDPRLRAGALRVASTIPARTLLAALGLDAWPDAAAPAAIMALELDAWHLPSDLVSPRTLEAIASAPGEEPVRPIIEALRAAPAAPLGRWAVVASVGAFSGFGGSFDAPPLVLDGGDRHMLHVRVGDAFFVVEADVFGWSCRREHDPALQLRRPEGGGAMRKLAGKLGLGAEGARVSPEGIVEIGRESLRVPALRGCTAFSFAQGRLAATTVDSHHIRILTSRRDPL
jgi:hypothetical protein